jgi:menaquinone-dependent protoporphyrinogen oxidase
MTSLLIVYATTDGHTRRIGERLQQRLQSGGRPVVLKHLPDCTADDVAAAGAIVIGASIRYGKHKPEVAAFIARHLVALQARPSAFFSVNVVARKPGKDVPEGNPYLQKFLRSIAWRPQHLAVFAGRLDYPSLGTLDRTMIRFIMWMTKGPTDPKGVYEFTDWVRVDAFGDLLARLPEPATATGGAPVPLAA